MGRGGVTRAAGEGGMEWVRGGNSCSQPTQALKSPKRRRGKRAREVWRTVKCGSKERMEGRVEEGEE